MTRAEHFADYATELWNECPDQDARVYANKEAIALTPGINEMGEIATLYEWPDGSRALVNTGAVQCVATTQKVRS